MSSERVRAKKSRNSLYFLWRANALIKNGPISNQENANKNKKILAPKINASARENSFNGNPALPFVTKNKNLMHQRNSDEMLSNIKLVVTLVVSTNYNFVWVTPVSLYHHEETTVFLNSCMHFLQWTKACITRVCYISSKRIPIRYTKKQKACHTYAI